MNRRGDIFIVLPEDRLRLRALQAYASRVGKHVCQCNECEDFFITPVQCDRCHECGDSRGEPGRRTFRAERAEIEYNGE